MSASRGPTTTRSGGTRSMPLTSRGRPEIDPGVQSADSRVILRPEPIRNVPGCERSPELSYKPGRTHKARRQSDPPILVSDKLRRAAKAESTAAWHRAKMDRQIAALGRQPSDLPCLALE